MTDPSRVDERPESASNEPPAGTGELLRSRSFGRFFFANTISNTGNWFQNVAAGIVVYDITGSNTAVGAVSMLQFGATMLFTIPAGRLTDRVDRRWMLFWGQFIALIGALSLAVLVIVLGVDDLGGPWAVYGATAIIGVGAALSLPSLQALVPSLVRERDLDRAISLNSLTFNIARGIGPILAGLVVGTFGAAAAFGVNVLTFVPLLVVLALLEPVSSTAPPESAAAGTIREAVDFIQGHRAVVMLLIGTLAVGWASDPFSTLAPALADDLGHGSTLVGLIVGSFGTGAAAAALSTRWIQETVGTPRVAAVGLAVLAGGLVVLAAAPLPVVALVGSAIAGAGFLMGVTSTNSELQRGIGDELRGRVMAFWSVAFLGCRPLAALVDGVVADVVHPRGAVLVAAGVALSVAGLLAREQPTAADISDQG